MNYFDVARLHRCESCGRALEVRCRYASLRRFEDAFTAQVLASGFMYSDTYERWYHHCAESDLAWKEAVVAEIFLPADYPLDLEDFP